MKKQYYRIFTDFLPKEWRAVQKQGKKVFTYISQEIKKAEKHFNNLILFDLIISFFILAYFAIGFFSILKSVKSERLAVNKKFAYWKEVIRNYPNFPVAYYNAALFAWQLQKKSEAVNLLDKAIFLNPNFNEALELRSVIEK